MARSLNVSSTSSNEKKETVGNTSKIIYIYELEGRNIPVTRCGRTDIGWCVLLEVFGYAAVGEGYEEGYEGGYEEDGATIGRVDITGTTGDNDIVETTEEDVSAVSLIRESKGTFGVDEPEVIGVTCGNKLLDWLGSREVVEVIDEELLGRKVKCEIDGLVIGEGEEWGSETGVKEIGVEVGLTGTFLDLVWWSKNITECKIKYTA